MWGACTWRVRIVQACEKGAVQESRSYDCCSKKDTERRPEKENFEVCAKGMCEPDGGTWESCGGATGILMRLRGRKGAEYVIWGGMKVKLWRWI